jgi:hypothetical protein
MKETYTSKLYWKKWTHKVTFKLGQDKAPYLASMSANTKIKRLEKRILKAVSNRVDKAYKRLATSDRVYAHPEVGNYWRYSYEYRHYITIYFNDGELLNDLKDQFKDQITAIERPENEAHKEALLSGDKIVIREKLFYNRYRFVMRLGRADRNEITKWLDENLRKNKGRVWSHDMMLSGYWNQSIFFAHAEDAMLFKLSYSNTLVSSDRIKLLSEL